MPRYTPGYAKNVVGRTLRALVDHELTKRQIAEIWDFFRSECVYCGANLVPGRRMGHIDHLVAYADGGANHISNRVLACVPCNSDHKRDMDWQSFLKGRNVNRTDYARRKKRIERWQEQNDSPPTFDSELIRIEAERISQAIDNSVRRINRAR